MSLELKTVKTHKAPVRYIEGGSGQPLVFLHGAGGATTADPFLAKLAAKYHVYAPLLPGYGDSEECREIRDMLDFTLAHLGRGRGAGPEEPDPRRPFDGRHDRRRDGGDRAERCHAARR